MRVKYTCSPPTYLSHLRWSLPHHLTGESLSGRQPKHRIWSCAVFHRAKGKLFRIKAVRLKNLKDSSTTDRKKDRPWDECNFYSHVVMKFGNPWNAQSGSAAPPHVPADASQAPDEDPSFFIGLHSLRETIQMITQQIV